MTKLPLILFFVKPHFIDFGIFVNNSYLFNHPLKTFFPLHREAIENEREIFFNIGLVS